MAYEKQEWKTGDLITEGKLNHMEDGIKNASNINIPVKFGTGEKSSMTLGASTASGNYSFAEGVGTNASGNNAHAEGAGTTASGNQSHAEGGGSTASGAYSHAEGGGNSATNNSAHAEGSGTVASGEYSHAEGGGTIANHRSQHVFGEYNIEDSSTAESNKRGLFVEIVGNGSNSRNKTNARTLDWDGNEWLAGSLTATGSITIGSTTVTEDQLKSLLALLNN